MSSESLKVLVIDRDPGQRKLRIAALKKRGYKVFPALDLQQAKERCKPGAYDVIAVNAGEQPEAAVEFCESIRNANPKQLVLLMIGPEPEIPRLDYMVPDIPERLLERIDSLFADTAVKAA